MNTLINENNTINLEHLDLLMEKFDTNYDNAPFEGIQEYDTEYNSYVYDVREGTLDIINTYGDVVKTLDVESYTDWNEEETA